MTEQEFKEYIIKIENTEEFRHLLEILNIEVGNEGVFKAVKRYLYENHPRTINGWFRGEDYDQFVTFYEAYKKKTFQIFRTSTGEVDLGKTPYLKMYRSFRERIGFFTEGYIITPDETKYILKLPICLNSGISEVYDDECKYACMLASEIARTIGVATSENFIVRLPIKNSRIASKFFLEPDEDLEYFIPEKRDVTISEVLAALRGKLTLRHYPEDVIKRVEFEFLQQEFVAKLINLDDQAPDNSGLIVSLDASNKRHIRMAPMFDFDFSFFFLKNPEIMRRKCDNGKADVGSLVLQYKDNPDFIAFVRNAVKVLNMERVYANIYERTGLTFFGEDRRERGLKKYTHFLNKNINMAKKALEIIDGKLMDTGEELI